VEFPVVANANWCIAHQMRLLILLPRSFRFEEVDSPD